MRLKQLSEKLPHELTPMGAEYLNASAQLRILNLEHVSLTSHVLLSNAKHTYALAGYTASTEMVGILS